MSVARMRLDGSIVVWLSAEEAEAVRTAITLYIATSPEGVPIREARMLGEIVAALDAARHPQPQREMLL